MLAVDPGERRIGVAMSDSSRSVAFPREAILAGETAIDQLEKLVEEEGVRLVVIGLPRMLNGREGPSAVAARRLGAAMKDKVGAGVEVIFHDERLTTVAASRSLRSAGQSAREQRTAIDSAAATVLLESWIQAQ